MTFLFRLGFVLKEGFTQLLRTRGPSTAIVVIVASTLLQLSLFLGITRGLDRALATAKKKFELAVFFAPSADAGDRRRVAETLAADPRVGEVKVVTKEAYAEWLEFAKEEYAATDDGTRQVASNNAIPSNE